MKPYKQMAIEKLLFSVGYDSGVGLHNPVYIKSILSDAEAELSALLKERDELREAIIENDALRRDRGKLREALEKIVRAYMWGEKDLDLEIAQARAAMKGSK